MSPYRPTDISKSENARKPGTKKHKSSEPIHKNISESDSNDQTKAALDQVQLNKITKTRAITAM